MKKIFFLTLIAVVCLYGFRGSGWRGDTSKDGDYTFNDDVYITDSLYAGRASIGGTSIKSNGSIWCKDTLKFIKSATDTINMWPSHDTFFVKSKLGSFFLDLTQATVLFKSGWMLFDQMKPATTDSASSGLGSSDNPYGINHFMQITAHSQLSDSAKFTGTCLADTVVRSSFTTTSFIYLSECGATPWLQRLGWTAKTNTLFVYTVVGDSAKARTSGYKWLKLN